MIHDTVVVVAAAVVVVAAVVVAGVVVVVGFWVQRCHSLGPIKRWLEAACPMP